jgi:putative endonuclease
MNSTPIERSPRRQVAGSNPVTPTTLFVTTHACRSMFHVYVLRSGTTGHRYAGSREDINDRLRRLNAGESKATKHETPWTLLHTETFATRSAAMNRERYFKTGEAEMNSTPIERSPRRQVAGSNPVAPTTVE